MGESTARRRHPRLALTARSVQSLRSTGRVRRVADGGGLYLLISPTGSKSWVLRTVVSGKRCDIGLGGATLVSLGEAREQAYRLRKIARGGGDPLAERRHGRRTVLSFQAAAEQVHAAIAPSFRNQKHAKQWLASLAEVFAIFGDRRVDTITSADIMAALSPYWLVKPETSRRVLQRIRNVFDWCKAQRFCVGDNPTQGLTKVLPKHRGSKSHHPALPYAETPGFFASVQATDAAPAVKLALEFTILCAARTSETLLATWDEIDLTTKTWRIPASRMKAAAEHRVPLGTRCAAILQEAKRLSNGGPYVFPGRTSKKPLSNMALLMLLRRMKRDDLTVHGFRSTFRDWAAEQTTFARAVCEAALAHTLRDKAEAAYNRTDLFERRRELMDAWEAFASSLPLRTGAGAEP